MKWQPASQTERQLTYVGHARGNEGAVGLVEHFVARAAVVDLIVDWMVEEGRWYGFSGWGWVVCPWCVQSVRGSSITHQSIHRCMHTWLRVEASE